MLRSAGKFVGTAAGVAASGPASQSQCRAQQSRLPKQHVKEDCYKGALPTSTAPLPDEEHEGDWLLTDFKRDQSGEHVIFGYDEVNSTLDAILAFTGTSNGGVTGSSSAHITEMDGQSESSTDTQDDVDANLQIQAAEMQLAPPPAIKEDFTRALSNLLHNPGVQDACLQALKNDPSFSKLLEDPAGDLDIPVHNFSLLPLAAQQAAQAEGEQSSAAMAEKVAQALMRIGEAIKQTATGVRDSLGRFFINLGCRVHAVLGRPFGSTPLEESDPERRNKNAEAVGNALVTIACAILALVLVKRVHRIRFV